MVDSSICWWKPGVFKASQAWLKWFASCWLLLGSTGPACDCDVYRGSNISLSAYYGWLLRLWMIIITNIIYCDSLSRWSAILCVKGSTLQGMTSSLWGLETCWNHRPVASGKSTSSINFPAINVHWSWIFHRFSDFPCDFPRSTWLDILYELQTSPNSP